MSTVSIIGVGNIGSSVMELARSAHILGGVWDKNNPSYSDESRWESIVDSSCVFICTPVPTKDDSWDQDLSELQSVLTKLDGSSYAGVVTICSSILPGTTRGFNSLFSNLRLVHNPICQPDFGAQECVMVSGDERDTREVWTVYDKLIPKVKTIASPAWEDTELSLYFHNSHASMNMSFANEFYDLCNKIGVQFNFVRTLVSTQNPSFAQLLRVSEDARFRGFGGELPKDCNALVKWAENKGGFLHTVGAAVIGNKYRRPEYYSKAFENAYKEKKNSGQGVTKAGAGDWVSGLHESKPKTDLPN